MEYPVTKKYTGVSVTDNPDGSSEGVRENHGGIS